MARSSSGEEEQDLQEIDLLFCCSVYIIADCNKEKARLIRWYHA